MKTLIAVLLFALAAPGHAATYQGKKCKLLWDKEKRTAEAECFAISKSEHTLIINTAPAPVPTPAAPPLDDRWKLK